MKPRRVLVRGSSGRGEGRIAPARAVAFPSSTTARALPERHAREPIEMAMRERRFWARVDATSGVFGCWPWIGPRDSDGYGQVKRETRQIKAHRLAYELAIDPIPDGLHVCHHCDNPSCCNPFHRQHG
jgi:hypothetical protein